jgi:cell division protein FtsN
MKIEQRGSFVLGMVVGLLVGLSLALGVALYITKAPIPFVNKVPPRTAEQDKEEAERNRNWDPNAPLAGRTPPAKAGAAASAPAATVPAAAATVSTAASAAKSSRDPAAILSGAGNTGTPAANSSTPPTPKSTAPGIDPFVYFVQVGAYANADEAEQQRAKVALQGLAAKVTEREQSGRTMYRVRLGPYEKKEDADNMQSRLTDAGVEGRLVRVERN